MNTLRALSSKIIFLSASDSQSKLLDSWCDIVHRSLLRTFGIILRADAWAFRPEQAMLGTDRLDQQPQGALGVQHSIKIELAEILAEIPTRIDVASDEPADLIRYRAAAMADDDLKIWEVREHVGVDEVIDRRRLLVDEMQRIGFAVLARSGRMDVRGQVELAQLLVERIPVALAQPRRMRPGVLVRIGVEQAAP